ncbi:MAG: hypothetical protein HY075_05720 [Deltaproteobacteria bacterium]|nr:hypothetical protein [Deltaproteobacteria bacterium]
MKMLALKRTSPKTVKTDEIYNFVVNLGAWYEVVGVNYASKQEGYGWDRHVVWGAQEALGFERQGDFDYVHRGVVELGEGRRGD